MSQTNGVAIHRGSMLSQNSQSLSGLQAETEVLTDVELVKLVEDETRSLRILKLENQILESTIMRVEPSLLNGVYQALDYLVRMNSSHSSLQVSGSLYAGPSGPLKISASKFGLVESLLSSSRASTRRFESTTKFGSIFTPSGPRINILERSELVSIEMEIQISGLAKFRDKTARKRAILKAQLEEVADREKDIETARQAFKQQVQIQGWDKITQRIPAEVWIKYMTDWMKLTDSQIGKLRLRTSTFTTMYSKLKSQLKVKEELSERLRPVDFEKLKIENKECEKMIEQKLQQLGELKNMTGDANLNLSIHKKLMMEQNQYLARVLETTKKKEEQTVELDKESDMIQIQADILAYKLNEIRKIRATYHIPDVMDYVNVKCVVTELKHTIKMLENRAHIQSVALSSLYKKLHNKPGIKIKSAAKC